MRAGNWGQAKRFMQNFSGEGAEYQALSSIVKFCVGDNESLQDLSKNWSQASYALRARSTQYLVACLSSEEPDLTRLNEFRELMGNQFSETLIVREFYLKSLLELGEYSTVRSYNGPLDNARIIDIFAKAHQEVNHKKVLMTKLESVSLSNREVSEKVLGLMVDNDRASFALSRFDELKESRLPWVADVFLFLGDKLENSEMSIEGYRRKIAFNPMGFESYRGLASLYFKLNDTQSGDEVLLKYLRKFPQKYRGAKEIAQVLIDFGRFDELMMFIKNMRKQLNDPNAFMDIVLYAYSIKLQINNFLGEIKRSNPVINPSSWSRRIVDSFQHQQIEEVYSSFVKNFSSSSRLNLKLLINLMLLSKQDLGSWVDDQISTFPATEIEAEVLRLISGSHLTKAYRVISSAATRKEGLTKPERAILGDVLFKMGKYDEAYTYLNEVSDNYSGSGELYFNLVVICARSRIWRTNLSVWLTKLRASNAWQRLPKSKKQFISYVSLEQDIYTSVDSASAFDKSLFADLETEQKIVLQLLDDLFRLGSKNVESSLDGIKSFLNAELSAEKYPNLQFLYLVLLDLKGLQQEDFWVDIVKVLKLGLAGDNELLEQETLRLEQTLQDHYAEVLVRDLIMAHKCIVYQQMTSHAISSVESKQRLNQWETQVSKLFEEFPQSLYTPLMVDNLVVYFESTGLIERRNLWMRKYMLRYSSDLLSQKFRNKLL